MMTSANATCEGRVAGSVEAGAKGDSSQVEELQERIAELVAANNALEAFTYSIAHDLRAPLRAIGFFGGQLAEKVELMDEDASLAVSRIHAAKTRMDAMITDLIDFSRVARQDLFRSTVNLSAMMHEIARDLCAANPHRDIEWRIGEGLVAQCDPGLVRLVLENLAGNAFKYTRPVGRGVVSFGACMDEAGTRTFFVSDNGVGFDMRYVDKLFKAFSRLHGADRFEGNGIGLATVRRIVERHGGYVKAFSAPERGATFTFTLGPCRERGR